MARPVARRLAPLRPLCRNGSSRSSPSSSTRRRTGRTGSTKSSSTATACMRASTAARCDCSPAPGSTGRTNIRRSPTPWHRSAPGRPISTASCAACAPDGVTSFSMIQLASDSGNAAALVFFLFDLLHLDGEDLCPRPLIERKARLAALAVERELTPALLRSPDRARPGIS